MRTHSDSMLGMLGFPIFDLHLWGECMLMLILTFSSTEYIVVYPIHLSQKAFKTFDSTLISLLSHEKWVNRHPHLEQWYLTIYVPFGTCFIGDMFNQGHASSSFIKEG